MRTTQYDHKLSTLSLTAMLFSTLLGEAAAAPVATPDMSLIPLTTSGAAYFLNNGNGCASIGGNSFCVTSAIHIFFPPLMADNFIGGNEVETANSEVIAQVSVNGGPSTTAYLIGPATVTAFGRTSDNETGTFATRMDFDLRSSIGGLSIEFESIDANPTLGQITFSTLNRQDYTEGYFDVNPQISLNGSPFIPEISPTAQVARLEAIPEPSAYSLLLMGLVCMPKFKGWRKQP